MDSGSIADWLAVAIAFVGLLVYLIVERDKISLYFRNLSRRQKKEKPEQFSDISEEISLETKTLPIDNKNRVLAKRPTAQAKGSNGSLDNFVQEAEIRTALFIVHVLVGFIWGALLGIFPNRNFFEGLSNGVIFFGGVTGFIGLIIGGYLGLSRRSILAAFGLAFGFFMIGIVPGGIIGLIVGAIFGLFRINSAWSGGIAGAVLTLPWMDLTTFILWIAIEELPKSFKRDNK